MIQSIHVVPSINAEASGVSYCVPRICSALASQEEEVELHVLAPAPQKTYQNYEVHAHSALPVLKRFGISPDLRHALTDAAGTAGIMHSHSLWMMPNIYPASAVKGTQCRLVTSPHGCFSDYMSTRSRLLKKMVWSMGQGRVLRNSACIHATAENEYRDIRRNGLSAPVAVIPLGVDIPAMEKSLTHSSELRRLLFLSRIHPQKGIDTLLHAWGNIERQHPDWELCIVGPDDGQYFPQMRAMAKALRLERAIFPGPAYGQQKSEAFWSAELFVLPSHSENFGVVVAEALAHGIPAIVTAAAPWSGLATNRCGWWIENGVEYLTDCLEEAMSKSTNELSDMGTRGREWMEQDFAWGKVGKMMHETYEWLLGGGPPLQWVITD